MTVRITIKSERFFTGHGQHERQWRLDAIEYFRADHRPANVLGGRHRRRRLDKQPDRAQRGRDQHCHRQRDDVERSPAGYLERARPGRTCIGMCHVTSLGQTGLANRKADAAFAATPPAMPPHGELIYGVGTDHLQSWTRVTDATPNAWVRWRAKDN